MELEKNKVEINFTTGTFFKQCFNYGMKNLIFHMLFRTFLKTQSICISVKKCHTVYFIKWEKTILQQNSVFLLDIVHRLYFNKITTFRKLDLLPKRSNFIKI
jgi:hypothetical protein